MSSSLLSSIPKVIIIIVLKLDLRDQSGVRPESRVEFRINTGQRKDKNNYYYNFKIRLEGRSGIRPRS